MDIEPYILLFDYEGAAKALSMSRAALRDLVYRGNGPKVRKIGRRTFFTRKDLEEFVDTLPTDALIEQARSYAKGRNKKGRPRITDQLHYGTQT